LENQSFDKDAETLQKFYDSVKMRASGIDNAEGKQRIIIELYDKFFKTAFPKMVEQLGIVYTPVEVVDFIIHSVNDMLKKEFGRSISDENVHVLDPFTGTGTFMTRLLQSGLIPEKDLERKYRHELHANEIVLLAYYIATINIENAFHDATLDPDDGIGKEKYIPFDGIVLTDTFQLGETDASEKMFSEMFPQNSERVAKQKNAPLRVIIGNPPYSVGQKDSNDNAQNQKYEKLESRIETTYAKASNSNNKRALYDSYFKAFRWSADRLDKNGGIIAFVSNGAWIDGSSADGFRKSLENEFTSIYVFNLRGNQRTSGELSRKEGGKIFGAGSRTPIAITFLVKNPNVKTEKGTIYYHDIGDYLSREEKLTIVSKFQSGGHDTFPWRKMNPDIHGDWIGKRNSAFEIYIPVGNKDDKSNKTFFNPLYSRGLGTSRDAWVYNFSSNFVLNNMKTMIENYNNNIKKLDNNIVTENEINKFIDTDPKKIAWTSDLKRDFLKHITHKSNNNIRKAAYRPYCKQNIYFDRNFIYEFTFVGSKIFPKKRRKI